MASDVKWIKITTDIFDDEKMLMIEALPSADSIIVVWFKLLTFAGKQNNDGVFVMNNRIAYTDEMLASIFRRDINVVRFALETFERFGMIDIIEGVVTIPNWNKHQTLDSYEKKKERDRIYSAERRAKQRLLISANEKSSDSRLTSNDKSLSVAISEEEKEKEIELDKDNNIGDSNESRCSQRYKRKPFVQPTVEEVQAYCMERMNNVNAESFVDFYESKGWYVGKNKMKDWKAAVRTWEKGNKQTTYTNKEAAVQNRMSVVDNW